MGSAKKLFADAFEALKFNKAYKQADGLLEKRIGGIASESKLLKDTVGKKNSGQAISEDGLEMLKKHGMSEMKNDDVLNKGIDKVKKLNDTYDEQMKLFNSEDKTDKAKLLGKRGESWQYQRDAAKDYLTGGSKFETGVRYGAMGAIGATGAIGARYASGGDLTHDRNNNSDLVGIPFV